MLIASIETIVSPACTRLVSPSATASARVHEPVTTENTAFKLPVGAIHAKGIAIKVEPLQNQPSKLFIAVGVTSKKALDSAIAGLCLSLALEGFRGKSCKSGFTIKSA